jgi:hypothetical protein
VSWADAAHVVVALTAGLEALGGGDGHWLSRQSVTRAWELLLPRLAGRGDLSVASAGSRQSAVTPQQ